MSDHVAAQARSQSRVFTRSAQHLPEATGSGWAVIAVAFMFGLWLAVGIAVDFPRWLELSATAGVPFLTLLMLVLIQHTQNHDDLATQLKLDELIRANERATNRMMTVEGASREDLGKIQSDLRRQADSAESGGGEPTGTKPKS